MLMRWCHFHYEAALPRCRYYDTFALRFWFRCRYAFAYSALCAMPLLRRLWCWLIAIADYFLIRHWYFHCWCQRFLSCCFISRWWCSLRHYYFHWARCHAFAILWYCYYMPLHLLLLCHFHAAIADTLAAMFIFIICCYTLLCHFHWHYIYAISMLILCRAIIAAFICHFLYHFFILLSRCCRFFIYVVSHFADVIIFLWCAFDALRHCAADIIFWLTPCRWLLLPLITPLRFHCYFHYYYLCRFHFLPFSLLMIRFWFLF